MVKEEKRELKVALYLRSSKEQEEDTRNVMNPEESDTIANQRRLLRKTAVEKGFLYSELVEYIDDGHTGTNFQRPAFQKLLADVENGKIKAVIVKDFSRMGRDYIGVGEYVEQYFPKRGVRIISVNDRWDSDEHAGETMALDTTFRTMIYDMYSRDLSKKRISANAARNKEGIFIAGLTPYGYKKIPGDTHSIIVDDTAAPIVRRIFQMTLEGKRTGEIAKQLNDEGIPAPAKVKRDQYGIEGNGYGNFFHGNRWNVSTLAIILRNETYTGTLILNRMARREFGSHKCKRNKKEDWFRFPGHHEAIITKETFDAVQKKLRKSRDGQEYVPPKEYIPLYCPYCGEKLRPTTRVENTFICYNGQMIPASPCGQMQVRREKIKSILVKAINTQAKAFLSELKGGKIASKKAHLLQERINLLKKEKDGYRNQRMTLYTEFKAGRIEQEEFLKKKNAVLKLESECLDEYESAEKELQEIVHRREMLEVKADRYKEFAFLKTYDGEIVKRLISKVECFNDGHIKIHWNFKAEFKDVEPVEKDEAVATEEGGWEETVPDAEKETKTIRVAAYTSDLWKMPQTGSQAEAKDGIEKYCLTTLKVSAEDIRWFHDDKNDDGLFYQEAYMRFIDAARSGKADVLIINSFRDLYLGSTDLRSLLQYVIPKLNSRFISVADGFDSKTATDADFQEIFQKHRGARRGDIISFRAMERKEGKRVAKEILIPTCTHYYGYHVKEDGCYADQQVLEIIRKIFQMADETGELFQVARWLNREEIPTAGTFLDAEGINSTEHIRKWNAEKVWRVTKTKIYVEPCKYCEKCRKLGRHCEIRPIIGREQFDEVNRKCRYRKNRN